MSEQHITGSKVKQVWLTLFLFTTFSGVLRKWVTDSTTVNYLILFLQLLTPYFFLLLQPDRHIRSPFNKVLIWYCAFLLLMALNPMNLTLLHGILGILTHLGFWFCCFFYLRNQNFFDLKALIPLIAAVCIGEVILGFIQYNLPLDHFLNRYANADIIKNIAEVNGFVRITGTFSYLGGYNSFLMFYGLFVWALIRLRYNGSLIILIYLLGFFACFMSGARTPMYVYLVLGILMVFFEYGLRRFWLVAGIASLVVIIAFTITYFIGSKIGFISSTVTKSYENFEDRRSRNARSGEEESRIIGSLYDVVFFPGEYPLIGVGLGATYQGATAVLGVSPYVRDYPSWLEEEPERIVLEGGFVLFALKILLFFYFFRHLKIPFFAKIVIGMLMFLFLPIVYNIYSSIYLFLGLIFLDRTYHNNESVVPNNVL